MALEIFTGVNCCHRIDWPGHDVRITPRKTNVAPGGMLNLSIVGRHIDCDESCFTWAQIAGGGRFPFTTGETVVYYAPTDAPDCEALAVITLSCNDKIRDNAFISITKAPPNQVAYQVFQKGWWLLPDRVRAPWPDPNLPPCPPLQAAPKHIEFSEGVVFPTDWKPGNDLPAGVTVDRSKLIPDDWEFYMLPPFGVKIEPGTKFPPDWVAGDDWPEGMSENTFELFPEEFEPQPATNRYEIICTSRVYDCADKFIRTDESMYWSLSFFWHKAKEAWFLDVQGTPVPQPFNSSLKAHMAEIQKNFPLYEDWRSPASIKAHCCPINLLMRAL